jgi:hypothetical protein
VSNEWPERNRSALTVRTRDQRRSTRVDVLMRVHGELVELDTPIIIHDMSRTGFAAVSQMIFQPGQQLDFRLVHDGLPPVLVTAEAVHSRPAQNQAGLYMSGFKFVPGQITGLVPQARIDRLIEVLSPVVSCF